jgi:hypothetical protein
MPKDRRKYDAIRWTFFDATERIDPIFTRLRKICKPVKLKQW